MIFIGPAWFQTALYWHIISFPFLDKLLRWSSKWTWLLWLKLIVFQSLTIVVSGNIWPAISNNFVPEILIVRYTTPLGWITVFAGGCTLLHVFRRYERKRFHWLFWALITDVLSLAWVGLLALAVHTGPTMSDDEESYGRYSSIPGLILADVRMAIPFVALWVYGLAIGHGITAWFFSLPFVIKHLAPLSYPLYLFHLPVAYYAFYITRGVSLSSQDAVWLKYQGMRPANLAWYALFICIVISLALGWLYNRFLNSHLIPPTTRAFRFVFRLFTCRCGNASVDVEGHDAGGAAQGGTLALVQATIRKLSGADVTAQSRLDEIGLDSLGATALCGALRSSVPAAVKLRPVDIFGLTTIDDLVRAIDALETSKRHPEDVMQF